MKLTAAATCGVPIRVSPAGFDHSVLASSAAAAPPANALPIALPEFSCSAKPADQDGPAATASAIPVATAASRPCLASCDFIVEPPLLRYGFGAIRRHIDA